MKPYARNPRRITTKRVARLTDTLARLGDLGGIVHNLETDEIIGGNQRMAVFRDGQAVVTETLEAPDDKRKWRFDGGKVVQYRVILGENESIMPGDGLWISGYGPTAHGEFWQALLRALSFLRLW